MGKATVCIWMPSGNLRFVGTVFGVGHAALKLKTDRGKRHYITWMAHGSPFNALVPSQHKGAYKKIHKFDYAQDQENMEQFFGHTEPDFKINLPTLVLPPGNFQYGVDVSRVERFWKRRLNLPVNNRERHYAFLSKKQNCTGCVVEALRAGGLDWYLDKPFNWFVQDAKTLQTWVEKIQTKLNALNELQTKINRKIADLLRTRVDVPRQDRVVPTYEEWKTESNKKVSFRPFAQRKEQVAALDAMIKDYPNVTDKVARFVLLTKMQSEIYSHLTSKPNSDRRNSVEVLGVQVATVLNDLLTDGEGFDAVSDEMYSWIIRTLAWRTD